MERSALELSCRAREVCGPFGDTTLEFPVGRLEFLPEVVDASRNCINEVAVGSHRSAGLEAERGKVLDRLRNIFQARVDAPNGIFHGKRLDRDGTRSRKVADRCSGGHR